MNENDLRAKIEERKLRLRIEARKQALTSTPASGQPVENVGGTGVAAPPPPARPGLVGRAFDFARRAFYDDNIEPSKRGIIGNTLNDAKQIITGTSHLIGQTGVETAKLAGQTAQSVAPLVLKNVLGQPIQSNDVATFSESPIAERAKALPDQVREIASPEGRRIVKEDFVKPAAKQIKNSFTSPIKSFSEHPLFTVMDWTTAASLVGGAARAGINVAAKGAQAAGKAGMAAKLGEVTSTARAGLPVAPGSEILRDFSKNPIVKYGIQKPFDKIASNPVLQEFITNSPILKWISPDAMVNPEARAGRVAEKIASRSQSEFFQQRNAKIDEAMKQFNKLPEKERESFVAVIQGRAMPRQQSIQFKEVYDWYKNTVADEQSKLHLQDETVKRVAYQPLAVANGLLTPEDYKLAMRGDAVAAAKVRKVTDDLSKSRVRVQEQAIKEWLGDNTNISLPQHPKIDANNIQPELLERFYEAEFPGEGKLIAKDVMTGLKMSKAALATSQDSTVLEKLNAVSQIIDKAQIQKEAAKLMRSRDFTSDWVGSPLKGKALKDAKEVQALEQTLDGYLINARESQRTITGLIPELQKFSERGRPRRVNPLNALAKELADELSPDPVYFPSVFQNKLKVSDFMPNKFLQRFKPGFMKGRTGAFGFIEKNPEEAFAVHQSQVERYLQNEKLIGDIKAKFALPLKKATDLKPGYKIFAPDGYIGFYRGSMPLQESFLRGVGMGQNIDDAFAASISKLLPGMVENKSFVGVRKPTLYQVPADVASKVQDIIAPSTKIPEGVKLFYDKPLQAFKFSVLAMSPRWVVNNTLGNIMLTMSGRVSPQAFIKAAKDPFKEIIPPEVSSGGFRRAEFPGVKKVFGPQTGMADRVTGFFSGDLPTEGAMKPIQNVVSLPFKGAGKIADTVFEANVKIEDAFRNATFIDKTTKAAVEKIAKDTSTGIFDMKSSLNKFLERGSFSESNVLAVSKEMLKNDDFRIKMVGEVNRILNDYNALTKFEREIVRRAVPFWSWWKFINVAFWSMPVKDPVMAQAIKQLGMAGQEISAKEWKANGLNVDEVPGWMRGNVIIGKSDDKKLLEMINTKSVNPLSAAGEMPGLSPQMQMFEERRTGKNYLTGANFTHPNEAEVRGSVYRRENGKTKRIDKPTPPPILSHIARQFPQVNILESLMFPYRTYSGEGVFNNAVRTYRGKETPLKPEMKMANILGIPVAEADYRRLKMARREANQADLIIRQQTKRSGKALERLKLKEQE